MVWLDVDCLLKSVVCRMRKIKWTSQHQLKERRRKVISLQWKISKYEEEWKWSNSVSKTEK